MKSRIFFFAMTVVSFLNVHAQIEKGTYVPGISLNGSYLYNPYKDSLNTRNSSYFNAGVALKFGKFICNNLLLTPTVNYSYNQNKSFSEFIPLVTNPSTFDKNSSNYTNTIGVGIGLLKYN